MSSPPIPSSSPETGDTIDIVFSDPDEPFVVKPLIEDLLRTRYCIPGSVFLVERIDYLAPLRRRYQAIRLLVSDGISCMQAVLKGETHGLVDNHLIYAGCYIRVDNFELRFLDIVEGEEGGSNGERVDSNDPKGKGKEVEQPKRARKMPYVVLNNPITVGWNNAYIKILESHRSGRDVAEELEKSTQDESLSDGDDETPLVTTLPDKGTSKAPLSEREDSPDYGSIGDPDLEDLELPALPAQEAPQPQPRANSPKPVVRQSSNVAQQSSAHLPWTTDDPTKPVKLTPLRLIPNLPYKQNWMVNVLAVVSSLSDVEPSHLPPYHQRTARLTDPSTSKHVLLTVFLDPDDFTPTVGSVVLLLGIKNHRFDGGSLKKYASDRSKNGGRWWFEEPTELGWCDVAGIREWWDKQQHTT